MTVVDDKRCPDHDDFVEVHSGMRVCGNIGCSWSDPPYPVLAWSPMPSAERRRYLPTLAELIDRMSIVQLKEIFIPEHAVEYLKERDDIMHDINVILSGPPPKMIDAEGIHAIVVMAIANRFIWENESKARAGGSEQDKLLKLTHSVNGVRNAAKNVIASLGGERVDHKLDCLAADIPPEYGNWKIF